MLDRKIEEHDGIYTHEFFLAAGECNAESLMPLPFLVNRLIRVATEHANLIDVGYSRFAPMGKGWVLLKLAIEMQRYPQVNDSYTLKTWLETTNKLLSYRNFAIYCNDEVVGYVRSEWAMIDMHTRRMSDISTVDELAATVRPDVPCPIAPPSRLTSLKQGRISTTYAFGYCDVDFNRHVNTVRYIERLMNQWPLEHYDRYMVSRFEIVFMKECHYGMAVDVKIDDTNLQDCRAELVNGEVVHCRAKFRFTEFEK